MRDVVKTDDATRVANNTPSATLDEGLSIPSATQRTKYLETIARGEHPPMLIVSGLPGAGKTTILKFLQHDSTKTYTPTTRFMPRDRRPSDTAGDQPWRYESGVSKELDAAGADKIIFSNVKYQGYYGFPGADIVRAINRNEIPVMLVTSYVEMVQLAEALHNTIPVAPLVTLRLEVPADILPARILGRAAAHVGEPSERISRLPNLIKADALQAPLLHKVLDTRVVWNVRQDEIREHGFFGSQIQSLTPDAMAAIMVEATVNAQARAMCEAHDILTKRTLRYGDPCVPDSITEVLDRVLLPAAAERLAPDNASGSESPLIIKAGLAAAIYLNGKGRRVSPDIDYTLVESPRAKLQFELLQEKLSGSVPPWDDGKKKSVYHCEGLKGEARASDGTAVELDALLTTRVQPDVQGFCFLCTHDEHDLFHRRIVETPAGNTFGMIPPEQLCVEKLLAGRGPNIHKFDLFDASGLLAMYPLNANLVKKMIEMQRFDPVLDSDARNVLQEADYTISREVLAKIGITEPAMQHVALSMGELVTDEWVNYPSEERTLSLTALKQLAFLSAVERSLKKVESIMDERLFPIGDEKVSIGERFGREAVLEGVSRLRAQVLLHASYYVGMNDTFVRRALSKESERTRFFQHLDAQRQALSK